MCNIAYALHALHVYRILRSRDESIGDIKLMASYLSIVLETADKINLAYLENCRRMIFCNNIVTKMCACLIFFISKSKLIINER